MRIALVVLLLVSPVWASDWPESEFDLKSFKSNLEKDYFSCYLDQVVGFRDGKPGLYPKETITVIIGRDDTTTKGDGFFGDMKLNFEQSLQNRAASSSYGNSLNLYFTTRRIILTKSIGMMATGLCETI